MTTAAQYALLCAHAEDMFDGATLHPALNLPDWTLLGWLTASDALFGTQVLGLGQRVFYGFVAQSVSDRCETVVVIRGTRSAIEWLENIEGALIPGPHPGLVEAGFWSIYASLRLECSSGLTTDPVTGVLSGLLAGDAVTVTGHSLGAALATYLMADLARVPVRPSICGELFASPRPGDGWYAHYVDTTVGHDNYTAYAYLRDIVPHVPVALPFGLGFQSLPGTVWLKPNNAIAQNPKCAHSATSYAWLIDSTSVQPNGCISISGVTL